MVVRPAKTQISLGIHPVFVVRMKKAWILSYPLSAVKTLIRLGRCPGWSESSLGAHSFCWFYHVMAHITTVWDFIICHNFNTNGAQCVHMFVRLMFIDKLSNGHEFVFLISFIQFTIFLHIFVTSGVTLWIHHIAELLKMTLTWYDQGGLGKGIHLYYHLLVHCSSN